MNSAQDSFFANFLPGYLCIFTGIVPDNSQHTTHMDVGSAENAGAIFLPLHPWRYTGIVSVDFQHTNSIHEDTLELFPTILSIHSIHEDALELFPTILSVHSIHGDIR